MKVKPEQFARIGLDVLRRPGSDVGDLTSPVAVTEMLREVYPELEGVDDAPPEYEIRDLYLSEVAMEGELMFEIKKGLENTAGNSMALLIYLTGLAVGLNDQEAMRKAHALSKAAEFMEDGKKFESTVQQTGKKMPAGYEACEIRARLERGYYGQL